MKTFKDFLKEQPIEEPIDDVGPSPEEETEKKKKKKERKAKPPKYASDAAIVGDIGRGRGDGTAGGGYYEQ